MLLVYSTYMCFFCHASFFMAQGAIYFLNKSKHRDRPTSHAQNTKQWTTADKTIPIELRLCVCVCVSVCVCVCVCVCTWRIRVTANWRGNAQQCAVDRWIGGKARIYNSQHWNVTPYDWLWISCALVEIASARRVVKNCQSGLGKFDTHARTHTHTHTQSWRERERYYIVHNCEFMRVCAIVYDWTSNRMHIVDIILCTRVLTFKPQQLLKANVHSALWGGQFRN